MRVGHFSVSIFLSEIRGADRWTGVGQQWGSVFEAWQVAKFVQRAATSATQSAAIFSGQPLTQSNLPRRAALRIIRAEFGMPEVRLAIQEAKPAFGKWDYAMEGRRMFVPAFSLVGTQMGQDGRAATVVARRLRLRLALSGMLTALLAISTATGCRTPWRSPNAEPSFDRLIEIEQRSGQQRSAGREPQASHLRPGPAKYAMHGNGQGVVQPAAATSSRQSLSERSTDNRSRNQDAEQDLNDLEDMLVDVPPAQRELLRREMSAMQRTKHGQTDDKRKPAADPIYAADEMDQRSTADSDRPADSEEYIGSSKYQLASKGSSRQSNAADEADQAVDRAYSRRLSDRIDTPEPQAKTMAAVSTETVASQPSSAVAGDEDVVTASYAAGSQSADTSPTSPPQSESLDWRQHIAAALAQLETQSTAGSPEEQIHLQMVDRLLHMSLGDIDAASAPIEGLQANGQDFIRHSLKSLHDVTDPSGNPVEIKRYTLAMLSQRQAMSHLAAVSNLEVRNATFCTEVDGFGVVTKFPQYAFKADQELLLYCELDNFVSTQIEGKGYETQLQGSYEIVDSNGRRVADQLLPLDSHLGRNQRRDYFIAYRIYMPQKIEPGKYQLKLTVEDMKGRKFGQSALDFQIQ